MAEPNYQQAVEVLQNKIGMRWEGLEDDGRHEMARVLVEELGYDSNTAHEMITTMARVGTLRYHRDEPVLDGAGAVPVLGGTPGVAGSPTMAGYSGAAAAAPRGANSYWQIGHEMSSAAGRKGQVDPTV